MLFDALAIIGLILIGVGTWFAFGWPYAAIVVGVVLLIAGVKGALNDTEKDTQQTDSA